ncbi:Peroxisomal acyl-coenzyme A oxidase 1 [Trichoplax sp. H2]|nr:Peroxisomal acyl-coenzyme A oxidase 1 [Trichoplax sp. H2]|eukprot:RDD39536.1 Peroxisomal acyl-coenzyme A oxidase 1 [Trichoplax sp. H2]
MAKNTTTVSDLRQERSNPPFSINDMTEFYDGGSEATKKRKLISSLILNNPAFKWLERHYWTRDEAYSSNVQCLAEVAKILRKHKLNVDDFMHYYWLVSTIGEVVSFEMHLTTWKSALQDQGTSEQQKKWLPLVDNFKIVATYCQTELGHGTFIRGFETTATYDPKTREFILNTPTLTATKWWIGEVAKTATHALVMAQLWTQNKCYGPHLFILQVRSLEDHTPLPGITLGEMGDKFGYNSVDDGFMQLSNVRIPRDQMLMRHSKVTLDGSFIPPKNPRLTYVAITLYRCQLLMLCSNYLARASTIAVRYSAIRRQTETKPGYEPKVLDYVTQQNKLFPHIAGAYALACTGHYMIDFGKRATERIKLEDLSVLAEFHGISSGLKAFCTEMSVSGHIYNNWLASCTYEGENTVMYLQSAKYLLRCVKNPKSAPLGVSAVLHNPPGKHWDVKNMQDLEKTNTVLEAYRARAYKKVAIADKYLRELQSGGDTSYDAWNKSGIKLVDCAKAFTHYFVIKTFFNMIEKSRLGQSCHLQLHRLSILLALHGIDQNTGDFMLDNFIDFEQIKLIRVKILELFSEIRPVAVCLVDAFDIPDQTLLSVLGRYDGDVYNKLFEWAKEAPLNKTQVHSSYDKYLRNLLTSKL